MAGLLLSHPVMAEGTAQTDSIATGASGTLTVPLPANWPTAHALLLDATDASGTLIGRWSWGIASPTQMRADIVSTTSTTAAIAISAATTISVAAGGANNAITGQVWDYPEFKGNYSEIYWARLRTSEGPILSSSTRPMFSCASTPPPTLRRP